MKTQMGQVLTVTPMGVFIDGVPTKTYNGLPLRGLDKFNFGLIDDIIEIQVMQSDTDGKYGMAGTPTPDINGRYTWMRVKTDKGIWSDWLYRAGTNGLQDGALLTSVTALVDTFILASKKRRDFRALVTLNLTRKMQLMLDRPVATRISHKEKY